ncbi:ribonuclease H-like domain-containing protein [Tanacetum coccineum]
MMIGPYYLAAPLAQQVHSFTSPISWPNILPGLIFCPAQPQPQASLPAYTAQQQLALAQGPTITAQVTQVSLLQYSSATVPVYAAPTVLPAHASQATTFPQALHTMTPQDPSWNMDTGASSHLTDNTGMLTSFSNSSIYPSIFVGNGNSIPVTHTGHSFLHTPHKPLHLNHILVTPHIIKNLIYVRKFTRDNDVSIEFDAYGFSIKDYQTQKLLLRCDSTGDLYPVTQQPPLQTLVVLLSLSPTTWHRRLGHPGEDVYPLHKKSDLFDNFVAFRAYVNKQFNVDIKALQCDHGGEYDNACFHDLFRQNGIQFRFSCPRTSQQNGKSERMLRTVNNLIRTLLFQAHIPPSYWVEALNMAAHLLNILPSTAINNEIPFTKLYNQTPTYEHLRVFGCLCYPHVDVSHKLEPRSTPCIFLGYPANHRGYRSDGSLSRYKARLVANGRGQQQGIDYDETFSPVVKPATILTVLSLVVSRDWPIHQLDVKNAFLHGHLSKTIYMHQPPGFVDPNKPNYVCHLQRSLYGLKQAPRAWFQRFASYATRVGFQHSKTDSSLFVFHRGSDIAYLLLYVDDIILTASSSAFLQRIITSLHSEFAMTDLGSLNYFLGISAQRSATGLFLSQSKFAEEILERAHMQNCNPCRTPVDTESKLGSDGDPVSDPTLYRSLAGALQYLTFTRPDLSYAVQQVCLYMHDPRDPHFTALKRILRYVRGTLDYGLQLHVSSTTQLTAYTDADWAGCPVTRRSTSGYCVFLGDNLLSWSAKRQVTLSRSSAEAEYRGVANVVAETAWIRNLLCELHTPLFTATLVYCDNVSAVYMSANPVQHQRTKHIEIDIHFVRDFVASGQVRVLHVPSRFQYADIFTKGLPTALFIEFRSSLNVRRSPAHTEGGY